ncbi:conjugative transposon protein TraM [Microvirga sp. STR05]|uniref:Conjugative transposon protein TraM n=1 Tax=Hymenobacter duratus TaxID=2771356 RepID=A0ABR8JNQ1_9BACT|nr:conjugative transposon protein TraM [Hymenobacter duratus]MBD2717241.1 conjugative transposon protein TraM [Hymenobacter duratus]MBR7952161.1 conjugative transposon protein TraM [Microvirga sp. STR05]
MSEHNMQPVYPAGDNPSTEPQPASGSASAPATSATPRPSIGELARRHWLPLLVGIGMLTAVTLFFYARSLSQEVAQQASPVAATSQNLEPTIAPATPEAAPAPTDVLEQKQAAARQAGVQTLGTVPSPDQLAGGMAVDTVGQAALRRRTALAAAERQARAAANRAALPPPDSTEVTAVDAQTGAYRAVRIPVVQASYRGSSASVDPRRRLRAAARPRTAPDGVPYEQNDDVLDMLDAAPAASRASYEQMTGRRYFDRRAALRASGASGAAANNASGYDAFGTIKAGYFRYAPDNQAQLLPDIFYKAVINGEQKIRTGSVVLLRLVEDAVISGQTFPKNLVFAGVASVETNHVAIRISRLGPTRVTADIYDYHYLPGLMIDPQKRQPLPAADNPLNDARSIGAQEVGMAIDRSASAANSVVGVGGRVAAAMVGRASTPRQKLRDVRLPDGYPVLITTGATDAGAPTASN